MTDLGFALVDGMPDVGSTVWIWLPDGDVYATVVAHGGPDLFLYADAGGGLGQALVSDLAKRRADV